MAAKKERITVGLLDEKKIKTIMKRFLGTKESDPDVTKYYKIENGINYMATTIGSAVQIYFKNKHDGRLIKGTGETFFRKPLANDKNEDVQAIPEMETITEGKKKIKRPTGNAIDFPDVSGMFQAFDMSQFYEINIKVEDIDDFIAVHEGMEKMSKLGGLYNTAEIMVTNERLRFHLHDSPVEFKWSYEIMQDDKFVLMSYHYDFSLMNSILKSLKDLKLDAIKMYVKDKGNPILFIGETSEYKFNFAINRKLVK